MLTFVVVAVSITRLSGGTAPGSPDTPLPSNWLPLGEVRPAGWILEQMRRDLHEGFAGQLDQLCTEAAADIFGKQRNTKEFTSPSTSRYAKPWWNGEVVGNWRTGQILLAYLSDDAEGKAKATAWIQNILANQDPDGYLGIFDPQLRFRFPGELWTQTCLMCGLLVYSDLARRPEVLDRVRKAVDLTLVRLAPGKGERYPELGHDLMFTDVLEWMHERTGDARYVDFGRWLYSDYSLKAKLNSDLSLSRVTDPEIPFTYHGATTYEHIRVPLWLASVSTDPLMAAAVQKAFEKLSKHIFPSGAAVSEEWINDRLPDPSLAMHEYCASRELEVTFLSMLQKTGQAAFGDMVESVWLNAAQGARTADGRAVTYLTTDNRLRVDRRRPDGRRAEPRNQFSPTHTDVAVCCPPSASQVAGWYVRGMWMRPKSGGLATMLYGPCKIVTSVDGVGVTIEERTDYPFSATVELLVHVTNPITFPLWIRNPGWSRETEIYSKNAEIRRETGYFRVEKRWRKGDVVRIVFPPKVTPIRASNGEIGFRFGPLLFAQPIPAEKKIVKSYPQPGFCDFELFPKAGSDEPLALLPTGRDDVGFSARWLGGPNRLRPWDDTPLVIAGELVKVAGRERIPVRLVPMGCSESLLRRVTFPVIGP
ncbi:MAG: beta-L-arabinofuranosidase domain-containing protein [Acidobacteriota bacterium]